MDELPSWNDLSEHDRQCLETYYTSFGLKDGTMITPDNFDQGKMLGLEMFMIARFAIEKVLQSRKTGESLQDIEERMRQNYHERSR